MFYVQYSHARICSILEKAAAEGFHVDDTTADVAQLTQPAEFDLIRKLLELEEQIELAVDRLSPHGLTHYAVDLAKTFTAFYRDCRVIDAQNLALSNARLLLCQAARSRSRQNPVTARRQRPGKHVVLYEMSDAHCLAINRVQE